MALNLSRNTKVYFTTNVNTDTGVLSDAATGFSNTNTFEIQVLDGYSFTQNTETQQITVTEAGIAPVRGSRTFNTALAPVDFSFSTYFRPYRAGTTSSVTATERVLWNALFGSKTIATSASSTVTNIGRAASTDAAVSITVSPGLTVEVGDVINVVGTTTATGTATSSWNQPYRVTAAGSSVTTISAEALIAPNTASGTTAGTGYVAYTGQWASSGTAVPNYSYTSTQGSQKHQLQKFAIIFVVDNVLYGVENCCLTQASIDFGLDQLATCAWTGQGTKLKQLSTITAATLSGSSASVQSSAQFIANKLSTMRLVSKVGGSDASGTTSYTVAVTGGNITINNNVTYLTPANLGVVNTPQTYFTGTRSISGNVTAYLKTGSDDSNGTGQLLTDLLTNSATDTEPKFRAVLEVGGASNPIRVDFDMPGTMLQIPTVEVQDVVSTTINFVAQPFDPVVGNNSFALNRSNDLWIRYYAPAA